MQLIRSGTIPGWHARRWGLGHCLVLGLSQVLLPSWVMHQTLLLQHSHCQGHCAYTTVR